MPKRLNELAGQVWHDDSTFECPPCDIGLLEGQGLSMINFNAGRDDHGDRKESPRFGTESPGEPLGGLRALIVEDEALVAVHLENTLTAMGIEPVGVALTAEEAVMLAEAERPDFVTMDVRLHGERDGVSAAIEIFERFGIRSVFISAFGDAETVARGNRASPLGWLPKPLRQDQLMAALRNLHPPTRDS